MKKSLLIIGGNGFVGSSLIRVLFEDGYKITATYYRNKEKLYNNKNINYIKCDITNNQSLKNVFNNSKYDVLINAASKFDPSVHTNYTIKDLTDANILGHLNLISQAISNGVGFFIYFSSISIYEGSKINTKGFLEDDNYRPNKLYASSKVYAEKLLQINCLNETLKGMTLRLAGVHGIGRTNGVVYNMFKRAMQKKSIIVSEPKSLFRLTFIDDLIIAIKVILNNHINNNYSVYNVAGDDVFGLKFLAEMIIKIVGTGNIEEMNNSIIRNQVMNINKFKKDFDYKTLSLEKKLQTFFDYYKKRV